MAYSGGAVCEKCELHHYSLPNATGCNECAIGANCSDGIFYGAAKGYWWVGDVAGRGDAGSKTFHKCTGNLVTIGSILEKGEEEDEGEDGLYFEINLHRDSTNLSAAAVAAVESGLAVAGRVGGRVGSGYLGGSFGNSSEGDGE